MDWPEDWDDMTGDQRNEWLEAKNCVLYRGVVLMAREELEWMRDQPTDPPTS